VYCNIYFILSYRNMWKNDYLVFIVYSIFLVIWMLTRNLHKLSNLLSINLPVRLHTLMLIMSIYGGELDNCLLCIILLSNECKFMQREHPSIHEILSIFYNDTQCYVRSYGVIIYQRNTITIFQVWQLGT